MNFRTIIVLGMISGRVLTAPAMLVVTNQAGAPLPSPGMNGLTNAPAREISERGRAQQAEAIRTHCLQGGRYICGRVLQMSTNGLVVDSGYTGLLDPHYRQLWRVPGTALIPRPPGLVEDSQPGSPCVGLVFLTDLPRRPPVRLYDYVSIHAYPAGQYTYVPVPGVQKAIRKFAVRLTTAVRLQLVGGGG